MLILFSSFIFSQHVNPQYLILKRTSDTLTTASLRSIAVKKLSAKKNSTFQISAFPELLSSKQAKKIFSKYFILQIPDSTETEEIANVFSSLPDVTVEKSYVYHIDTSVNDSAYSSQWNLEKIGMKRLIDEGILQSLLPLTKVAIIDTGIDEEHPDLKNSIIINNGETGIDSNGNDKRFNGIDDDQNGFIDDWCGYNFIDFFSQSSRNHNTMPNDDHGHGTNVAGIIGAQVNNFYGIAGFGTASLLPLKAFSASGSGNDIDIAAAIIYAADNGAEVINMSFGDVVISQLLKAAIDYAYSKNIVLVASSGNDGSSKPHYPSDLSNVISVGSINNYNSRSIFSSYGNMLDIMAPGELIPTTSLFSTYTENFSGTSAAAPHVSGAVALLKSIEKEKGENLTKLSNEDWRGILMTTAVDINKKGWDEETGAGILNIYNASKAISANTNTINSPFVDEVINSVIPIKITALSPYFKSYTLAIGKDDGSFTWETIASSEKQCINDSVFLINPTLYESGSYLLKLTIENSKGNSEETRVRFRINLDAPKVVFFQLEDSVIYNDQYVSTITAITDIHSTATLKFRKKGSIENFRMLHSEAIGNTHHFILTSTDFLPQTEYEFNVQFESYSSIKKSSLFPTIPVNGFEYFSVKLPLTRISTTLFEKQNYNLPAGYILPDTILINGKNIVIINQFQADGSYGALKLFEFNGNFLQRDSLIRQWIPKSFTRNEQGIPLLLVQDYGTSAIFSIDSTTLHFSPQPVWIDSNDVWGSSFVDFNGDGNPDLIARSSSEILIYKNLGNEHFSLQTKLTNPSPPRLGDSKNQFGPPKILVSDFTNSGKSELVFADYDGDLLLYRQTAVNSFSFELAWMDTSDFLEMSDLIAAGDLNGDGIPEIASVGHTDLDFNNFREYNLPVWNVRIFSHNNSTSDVPLSVIWNQTFFGVHAGQKIFNGVWIGKTDQASPSKQLFLCLNPNIYLVDITSPDKFLWYGYGATNSFLSFNGLGFNTNTGIEFWKSSSNTAPPAPWNIHAQTLDSTSVKISWNSVFSLHNIYRGHTDSTLTFYKQISGNAIKDSMLQPNQKYYYAVKALTINAGESNFSEMILGVPHAPARIIQVVQNSPTQLMVEFSQAVNGADVSTAFLMLDNTQKTMSSVLSNSNKVLFTFAENILPGTHHLKIEHLMDATFMLADTAFVFTFITTLQERQQFFAQTVSLQSPNSLQIEFNVPINRSTALQKENYSVATTARQFPVERVLVDSIHQNKVILLTNPLDKLNDLSLRIEITLNSRLESTNGDLLNEGKGQKLSIAQEAVTLDQIVVYPNPARISAPLSEKIFFVNLPKNCKLNIFSVSGQKIKTLQEPTASEGTTWNMKDENGNSVSSGIYFYRVEQVDDNGNILRTKLGKFAIVK
ncbi:MAG: S8 family serine peptidase [Bacteroidetes bacterium]|nr:S8 family serine peptidase [Bacteroidota bacterium]